MHFEDFYPMFCLSNEHVRVGEELVVRYLEVVRRRALANAARDVVVRPVAGAEPSAVLAGVRKRHAAQVRAHANHNEPLRVHDALRVELSVTQLSLRHLVGVLNLLRGTVSDEHWLTTPLHGDGVTLVDSAQVHLEACECEDILRSGHGQDELQNGEADRGCVDEASSGEHEVRECALVVITRREPLVVAVVVVDDVGWVFQCSVNVHGNGWRVRGEFAVAPACLCLCSERNIHELR
mmetsp:Transcript_5222/g.13176  ORF Transcript_5222/g.13176 Transcript_5222/m.13176 type:complete len:237 (+) Transcript_5222:2403-3113(+)